MVIEASFTVEQSDFPLTAVFEDLEGATIELDRVVPTTDAVVPYLWIHGGAAADLTTDLSEDDGIDDVTLVDELDDHLYVRVHWNVDHVSLLTAIVETEVVMLSGVGSEERWTFEVRASEQSELSAFQTYCQDHDVPIDLTQLHELSALRSQSEYGLTDGQRQVLELAYASGYFDSPRDANQADIAEELGVSRQAVSSRLQRGLRRLLEDTVATPGE
jgi:predicted DNA binding protein